MADETRTPEARAQEMGRRAQDRTREAGRMASQLATVGAETLTVWADVNQRILQDVMDLTSKAAQESARLLTDLQLANIDTVQELQATAFRWQTMWPDAFRDPIRWYERAMEESVDWTHRYFGMSRRNAETITRSFERLQSSTEEAAKTLEDTFKHAASKMQDVSARAERLRVA